MDIYATYAATYYFVTFAPYWLTYYSSIKSTLTTTLAFSNLPGLRKPITFEGNKSTNLLCYFVPGGYTGIGISCVSYLDNIKLSIITDDAITTDTRLIMDIIEKNIKHCIEISGSLAK